MSAKNYKISIIVPVYNVANYIKRCLDSLINQTYKNLELILIDDGSIDNSGNICDEYAKKDSRIIVIHQKNSGVSKARNNGLDKMTGDYVMFVDSDDWIELDACERLIEIITKENLEVLIFNHYKEVTNSSKKHKKYRLNNIEGKELNYCLQAKILSNSIKIQGFDIEGIGFTWNKIISKKIINIKFPFEKKQAINEDIVFYYNLFEQAQKIGICNEYLYHYRILANSATRKYNKDYLNICDEFYKKINQLRKNHINDKYFEESFNIRIINNFCNALNVYINNKKQKMSFKQRIDLINDEMNKDYYRNAIKKVKMKSLNRRLKIYTFLLRIKAYYCILIINNLERIIKERMY